MVSLFRAARARTSCANREYVTLTFALCVQERADAERKAKKEAKAAKAAARAAKKAGKSGKAKRRRSSHAAVVEASEYAAAHGGDGEEENKGSQE